METSNTLEGLIIREPKRRGGRPIIAGSGSRALIRALRARGVDVLMKCKIGWNF